MCNRCDKDQSTGKIILGIKLKLGRVQQGPFSIWLVFRWERIIFLPITGILIMQIKLYFNSNEIRELLECNYLCIFTVLAEMFCVNLLAE